MKKFLYYGLLSLSLSCEVRPAGEQRAPARPKETAPVQTAPAPLVVIPPEPAKPKKVSGIPEGVLGEAMGYSLPNATGLFVLDVKRLASSAVLSPILAQLSAMLAAEATWREVISKAGLDPLRDLSGVVISIRQPTGASSEILFTLVGSFDAEVVAKALHDSPTRGDSDAVSVAPGLVLVGKSALLSEAKLASERGTLVDAPVMLAALSRADTTRPVFGAFFPSAASRSSARGSERANQVITEFDASQNLHMKIIFQFDTPKEAEDAKLELDDGLKQMGPMVGILGLPDPSALLKAFTVKTDGAQLTFLLALDSTTATALMTGIARFSTGAAATPTPAPVPAPVPVPTPVLPPG